MLSGLSKESLEHLISFIAELRMSDISGFLVMQRFPKTRSDIPVILLTSQEGQTQSITRESGIRWFAIKRLSITELSSTFEAVMNGLAN